MRDRALVLLLAAMGTIGLAAPARADEFFPPDKVAHFGGSVGFGFLAGTATYHLAKEMGPLERTLTSTAIGLVPGIGVEIGDEFSKDGHFSWGDLSADAIGSLTGAILAELVNGQFFDAPSKKQIRIGQFFVSASNKQIKFVARW